MELFSIKNKTALISGASRGIGLVLANGLTESGAKVYGFGRTNPNKLSNLNFEYIQNDIENFDETKNNIIKINKKEPSIEILINVAGITKSSLAYQEQLENFRKILNINLIAPFNLINEIIPKMKEKKAGSIINITSINAHQGFPNNPSYVSSKGALNSLTKSLAVDLGIFNIRVNNLVPGYIRTDMTEKSFLNKIDYKKRVSRTILGRWGDPKDLLGPCIFLASDASSYITGSDITVDGGWLSKGL